MMLPSYQAVIFDMDGVIFDSERLYLQCCKEAAEIFGADHIEQTVLACIGLTTEMTHAHFCSVYGEDFPLQAFWKEATGRFAAKAQGGLLPVKAGAAELLKMLRQQHIPTALASSTRTGMVLRELSAAGLQSCFDVIIGGDKVSRSKPEPDIFLLAASQLGFAAKDCIIIEDSLNGIRAASAAGGFVLMVPDLVTPGEEDIRLYTNQVLPSLTEVMHFFQTSVSLIPAEKRHLPQ